MKNLKKIVKGCGRCAGAGDGGVVFGDIAGVGERARIKKIAAIRGETPESFVKNAILGLKSEKIKK